MIINYLTADDASFFYKVCQLFDLDTLEQREALLALMRKKGMIQRAVETGRTEQQIVKDLAKQFNVLKIESKDEGSNETLQ